jgi:hypothetical protein
MSHEQPRWAPSRWSWKHIERTKRRVLRHAWSDLKLTLRPHDGALQYAELRAFFDSESSAAELKARGIRTLSDGTYLGPSPKPE